MEFVYFQPPGMDPKYCEVGSLNGDYIFYLNEPCKVLIKEVKIINKQNVYYDKREQEYKVKKRT